MILGQKLLLESLSDKLWEWNKRIKRRVQSQTSRRTHSERSCWEAARKTGFIPRIVVIRFLSFNVLSPEWFEVTNGVEHTTTGIRCSRKAGASNYCIFTNHWNEKLLPWLKLIILQATIASLKSQLEDIKCINLEMYTKLAVSIHISIIKIL